MSFRAGDLVRRKLVQRPQIEQAVADMHHDEGKPQLSLIPSKPLIQVAEVLGYGARKYAPRSYLTVKDGQRRYFDSLLRHAEALRGALQEDGPHGLAAKDAESGLLQLAHLAADALILLDILAHEPQE